MEYMLSKILKSLLLAILILLIMAVPVLAAYEATLTVTESNGNSYAMLGLQVEAPVEWLVDNGYIDSDALDTRVETIGGAYKPWLISEEKILFASILPNDSQANLQFTTDNIPPPSAMNIVTGYGGYITRADASTPEIGDDFEWDIDLYIDTDYAASKVVAYKESAFKIEIEDDEIITASIYDNKGWVNPNSYTDGSGNWSNETNIYDDNTATYAEESVPLNSWGDYIVLTPSASLFCCEFRYNAKEDSNIDEIDLDAYYSGAWQNVYEGAIGGDNAWVTKTLTDVEYVEEVRIRFHNDDLASAYDAYLYEFDFGEAPGVMAINQSTGECNINVTADTSDLIISIDSAVAGDGYDTSALSGTSVPDNANQWLFLDNEVSAYADYIVLDVASTEVIRYQPNDIIVDAGATATLPDRTDNGEGYEDGTITWGSNPAGVAVALGSLISGDQPVVGESIEDPSRDLMPEVQTTDWFVEPEVGVGGTLQTSPLRPLITMVSDNTTLSELLTWRLLGLIVVIFATVITAKAVPKHLGMACFAGGVATVTMVTTTIWPLWALVLLVLFILGGWVSERAPSI